MMNFETLQQNKTEEKEAIDDDWYRKFRPIGAFEEFEYLDGEKKSEKNRKNFFSVKP